MSKSYRNANKDRKAMWESFHESFQASCEALKEQSLHIVEEDDDGYIPEEMEYNGVCFDTTQKVMQAKAEYESANGTIYTAEQWMRFEIWHNKMSKGKEN